MRTPTKAKGIIGLAYHNALPPQKAAFRYALKLAGERDGENYQKRFTDYYQYANKKGMILSVYIEAAKEYLNYSDSLELVTV